MRAEAKEEIGGVANGWRPIETAPKRGEYLVYQPEFKSGRTFLSERICMAQYAWFCRQTTHWMPLPAPPIPQTQDKEA